MFALRPVASVVIAAMAMLLVSSLSPLDRGASASEGAKYRGHVYLLRGFLGVFSTGMDELADKLQARGIEATVDQHSVVGIVAEQAIADYRASGGKEPIFIVGHSLGGDAAMTMARILGDQGIPVIKLIIYDSYAPGVIPANVRHAVNYYQYDSDSTRGKITLAPGFHGRYDKINVATRYKTASIDHMNIDSFATLHDQTIRLILGSAPRR